MKERALAFRRDRGLIGILTQPKTPHAQLPTVILLNAGLIHRIGPYRLHVDLARHFARLGFSSLRFDLSGIGDSRLQRDSSSYEERINNDICHAMQAAEEAGCHNQFVAFGLCTGARNAQSIAVADRRVVGAILVDPFGYPTIGYKIWRIAPRIIDPRASLRFAARFLRRHKGAQLPTAQDRAPNPEQQEVFNNEFPPRAATEEQLRELNNRGTKLLFVYTGGATEYFNHRSQFYAFFPSLKNAQNIGLVHLPDTDHTFTCLHHRRDFVRLAGDWLSASFTTTG